MFSYFLILLSFVITDCQFIRCLDDKTQASNGICATVDEENEQILYYDNCPVGEICFPSINDNLLINYSCKTLESALIKNDGESCSSDGECIGYLLCKDNKCKDQCNGSCTNKQECYRFWEKNYEVYKCSNISLKGEHCFYDYEGKNSTLCSDLYYCLSEKCIELGSLDDGQECDDIPELCKSGQAYNGICISLKEEPICEREGIIQISVNGFKQKIDNYCYFMYDKNISEYSVVKTKFFKNYVLDFYSQLDKVIYKPYLNKKDYTKMMLLSNIYEIFPYLQSMELVDEDGKFDKTKCGYNLIAFLFDNDSDESKVSVIVLFLILIFVFVLFYEIK